SAIGRPEEARPAAHIHGAAADIDPPELVAHGVGGDVGPCGPRVGAPDESAVGGDDDRDAPRNAIVHADLVGAAGVSTATGGIGARPPVASVGADVGLSCLRARRAVVLAA